MGEYGPESLPRRPESPRQCRPIAESKKTTYTAFRLAFCKAVQVKVSTYRLVPLVLLVMFLFKHQAVWVEQLLVENLKNSTEELAT